MSEHNVRKRLNVNTARKTIMRKKDCFAKNKKACSVCRKTNQAEKDCFYRNKQKDEKKNDKDKAIEGKDKASLLAICMSSEMLKNFEFVIDNGTTCHMANTKTNMINTKSHENNIKVAKKEQEMHSVCRIANV
jgi:hypothetical protein